MVFFGFLNLNGELVIIRLNVAQIFPMAKRKLLKGTSTVICKISTTWDSTSALWIQLATSTCSQLYPSTLSWICSFLTSSRVRMQLWTRVPFSVKTPREIPIHSGTQFRHTSSRVDWYSNHWFFILIKDCGCTKRNSWLKSI